MRVLVLSQYYDPEPVEKVHDLARGLRDLGHEVHVLTGFPCYPAGRIYPGYHQRVRFHETIDGVPVTRVPQFPDHSRSSFRRILYYLSFAVSSYIFGRGIRFRPEVVLVYQAALPVGLSGWALSRRWRVPYVLDVVDLWPESVMTSGMMTSHAVERIIRRVAHFIYEGAAAINAVTDGFKRNLVEHGVPECKITVIENWMPESTYRRPRAAADESLSRRFIVTYAGNMGAFQDVSTIIEAAALTASREDIYYVLAGDGIEYESLRARADQRNLRNITFLGRRPPQEMPQLYADADVLIVHLKPDALTAVSIPSKTFAYLAAGKPLIMAVEGEASRMMERDGFGVAVPPCNPGALASAILNLYEQGPAALRELGERALTAHEEKYRGALQIEKMAKLIQSVASS